MRFNSVSGLLFLALLAWPLSPGRAQTASDTVRYREVAHTELQVMTPSGARLMDVKREARIAVLPGAGDTVRAWYEDLALEVQSLRGVSRPATAALLGEPFILRVDRRGRATTLQSPGVPDAIREIEDPSQQFTDFFPRLPAAPLARGLEWIDTLKHEIPAKDRSYRKYTAITNYRVEKDSMAKAGRVWVIVTGGSIWLETADVVPGSNQVQSVSTLQGDERGRLCVDARSGALVCRTRKGELNGKVTLTGPGAPIVREQTYWFESTITPASGEMPATTAQSGSAQ